MELLNHSIKARFFWLLASFVALLIAARLLIAAAPMVTGKDAAIQPYFDAVGTIKSDYERGRVLSTLLKNKQIG